MIKTKRIKAYIFIICFCLLSAASAFGYFNYKTTVNLVTCKALGKNSNPIDVTSKFALADGHLFVWLELEYVCQPVRIKFEYYDPDKRLTTTTISDWTPSLKPNQCIRGYKIWDEFNLKEKKVGDWLCKVSIEYQTADKDTGFYPLGKRLFTISEKIPLTKSLTLVFQDAETGMPINGVVASLIYPDRLIDSTSQEAKEDGIIILRNLPIGDVSILITKDSYKSEKMTITVQEDEYTFYVFLKRIDDLENLSPQIEEISPQIKEISPQIKDLSPQIGDQDIRQ
ncbi:MAG: hypothetical protein ACMUIP_08970 [bacterium]